MNTNDVPLSLLVSGWGNENLKMLKGRKNEWTNGTATPPPASSHNWGHSNGPQAMVIGDKSVRTWSGLGPPTQLGCTQKG
jgi:hypothetical protein